MISPNLDHDTYHSWLLTDDSDPICKDSYDEYRELNQSITLQGMFKEEHMKPNILVTYATKVGTTVTVAAAIADTLRENGMEARTRRVGEVHNLSSYDGVMVGSAIRVGKWLPEAVKFVEKNRDILQQKPLVYFTTCLTLAEADTPENRATVHDYLEPVREILTPQAEGFFAGSIHFDEFSLLPRFFVKMILKSQGMEEGDYRNWLAIREWTESVIPILRNEELRVSAL